MNISDTIIAALLGALVALLAAWLAFIPSKSQAKTERLRLRLELFERRIKIFQEVNTLITHILSKANIDEERILKFNRETNESYFLFGKEIYNYLWELHCKAVNLKSLNLKLDEPNLTYGQERRETAEALGKLLEWFADQLAISFEKFGKHMSLNEFSD
jgi:hypothetical protein